MQASEFNEVSPEPPLPFLRTSSQVLELREKSGCVAAVAGVPFLLAGIFCTLVLTGVVPRDTTLNRGWDVLVLPVMSIACLGVGIVLVLGRKWLILDRAEGSLTRQAGLLFPMSRQVRRLSEFTAVLVAYDRGDSDSPEQYPVRLRSISSKDFVLTTPVQFSDARKQAEYLSRFLRLPLVDATTDHEMVVNPDRVSDNLRQALLSREGEAGEYPTAPPRMRCSVTQLSSNTEIVIPYPGFPAFGVLGVFAAAFILFLITGAILPTYHWNLASRDLPLAYLVVMLILSVALLVGLTGLAVGSRRRGTTIKASPAGLSIERRTTWRTRIQELPASEILDLDQRTFEHVLATTRNPSRAAKAPDFVAGGFAERLGRWTLTNRIMVKLRGEMITFGEGLPAGELKYLRWVLRKALTGV